MRKVLFGLVLLATIITFFHDNNYINITQTSIVNSVGFDYDLEKNEFTMYFFILNNYNVARTGNTATHTETFAYISHASSKDIALAENKIRQNSNIVYDLSHVRSIVIHERFFTNDNILKLISYFTSNSYYLPSFEIYISTSDIDKVFKITHFSEVSAYYTILVNTQNNEPIKKITFNDLCNDIFDEYYTICYSTIKVNEGISYDDEAEFVSLEIDGCCFITENYQLCTFKYQNIPSLVYYNHLDQNTIEIQYDDNKNFFIMINDFEIKSKVNNNKLEIKIIIDGTIIDNVDFLSLENSKEIIKEYFTKNITQTNDILKSYDIDYYNISTRYKNKYNFKELETKIDYRLTILN